MSKILMVLAALALAACAPAGPLPVKTTNTSAGSKWLAECVAESRVMLGRAESNLRLAEAAKIAQFHTHDRTLTKRNVAMLEEIHAKYEADFADFKRRCRLS